MLPPGPRESAWHQAFEYGMNPYGFLERCEREFGDLFTIRFPHLPPAVTTSRPELIRELLALRPEDTRSDLTPLPVDLGARSVQFLDGDEHLAMRRVSMRTLKKDTLKSYGTAILRAADTMIDTWKEPEAFRFRNEAKRFSLDVIMDCMFGAPPDVASDLREKILRWTATACSPWVAAASLVLSGTRMRRGLAKLATLAGRGGLGGSSLLNPLGAGKAGLARAIAAEVERVRSADEERDDMLSQLARSRLADGDLLTVEEVVDQLVTAVSGGYDSTANTLCWVVQQIFSRPALLERLRGELAAVFPEGVDPARIAELPLLDACIKETLRFSPPFAVTARALARPKRLDAYVIPPGTMVWPAIYLVQRRPDVWESPSEFIPERFLHEHPPAHVYLPWGGGTRRCLGAHFATYAMQLVVARMIERVDLHVPAKVKAVNRGIVIVPDGELPVRCVRWSPAATADMAEQQRQIPAV